MDDALQATRAAMAEGTCRRRIGPAARGTALSDLPSTVTTAGVEIVRAALTEPVHLIRPTPATTPTRSSSRSRPWRSTRGSTPCRAGSGNLLELGVIDPLRVVRQALQNGASVAGLVLTTDSLVAEEQTPWNKSLMTEIGQLDEGLPQPSPDASTPQSLGLGPSMELTTVPSDSPFSGRRTRHRPKGARGAPDWTSSPRDTVARGVST